MLLLLAILQARYMEGIDAGLARCEELGIRYATEVCVHAMYARVCCMHSQYIISNAVRHVLITTCSLFDRA
jgi:hypothetical protein